MIVRPDHRWQSSVQCCLETHWAAFGKHQEIQRFIKNGAPEFASR